MNREHAFQPGRAAAHVNRERLQERIDTLARIGATARGGVNRQALTREDALAQAEMTRWGAALGLRAMRDPAGNFFLRLPGSVPTAAPVVSGSHLDSQPTGGRYDGVYGVVAAFEAVQAMLEAGVAPERPIEIVAWMNEEGSRFAPGMMGSAAFAGARGLDVILDAADAEGVRVDEALRQVDALLSGWQDEGLPSIEARPLGGAVHAYVETHIEQGPVLEQRGVPVGVVTGIQGKHTWRVEVHGEAAHAGTAARAGRKDALLAALDMVAALRGAFHDTEDAVRFTVGRFEVVPNAPSVVPERVVFSIDLRHPDTATLRALAARVALLCEANRGPCEVAVHHLSAADSLVFPAAMQARVREAAHAIGVPTLDLPSAAGHDARYLHDVAPTAMIFVPCHLGITHNEAEYASPDDMYQGARVLAEVLLALAGEGARA